MSSLEPVLKAYEGPDTLFLYNINAHSWVSAAAILIAITRVPGGARRSRTDDILLAKQALYQLSYGPIALKQRSVSAARMQGAVARRAVGDTVKG